MRFTVDSNILVYGFIREDDERHTIASELLIRAMLLDCVLAAQVLAEFLNVIRRKHAALFDKARAQAHRWTETMTVLDTRSDHVLRAAELAASHKLQLWDCIIWQVAQSAHATLFLSEDLQDRLEIDGMRIMNPFNPDNRDELKKILTSAEDGIEW